MHKSVNNKKATLRQRPDELNRQEDSCFVRTRAFDRLRNCSISSRRSGGIAVLSGEVYLDRGKTGALERVEFRPVAVQ